MAGQPSKSSPPERLVQRPAVAADGGCRKSARFVVGQRLPTRRPRLDGGILAAVGRCGPRIFQRGWPKALGYSGWDELRAALTGKARRAGRNPRHFSGRARATGTKVPIPDRLADIGQARSRGPQALAAFPQAPWQNTAKALHAARAYSGSQAFRSCRGRLRNCSTTSFACSGLTTLQLVGRFSGA